MEFIVMDDKPRKTPVVIFYTDKNYTGECQELPVGLFSFRQLSISEPLSVKMGKNAALALAEKTDRTGAHMVVTDDVPDLTDLPFKPTFFAVTRNVSAYRGEEIVATLIPGGYDISVLSEKGVDRLEVPEGVILRFTNGVTEEKSFSEGEVAVSEDLLKFRNFNLIHMWNQSDLSDTELAMVAGGKGGAEVCGAQACIAKLPTPDACGAKACAVNVIPVLPISI